MRKNTKINNQPFNGMNFNFLYFKKRKCTSVFKLQLKTAAVEDTSIKLPRPGPIIRDWACIVHTAVIKGQGQVAVNKPVTSRIYTVVNTWPSCSAQILVDGVNLY